MGTLKFSEKEYYEYYKDQLSYISPAGKVQYLENCLNDATNKREIKALMRHFKKVLKERGG